MSRPELFASPSAASARTMSAVASSFVNSSAMPPEKSGVCAACHLKAGAERDYVFGHAPGPS